MKTILSRSKTILSGTTGDVVTARESEEPIWLESVRLPTGTYLEYQIQKIKARHHTLARAKRRARPSTCLCGFEDVMVWETQPRTVEKLAESSVRCQAALGVRKNKYRLPGIFLRRHSLSWKPLDFLFQAI